MQQPDQDVSNQPIGESLRELGLLSDTQIRIILYEQQRSPGKRFGELLKAKGWVNQQTIDLLLLRQSRNRLLALLEKNQPNG
ncbi:hypothetical protein [Pantanalinema sp. GBBB05]|uniref:hypothetical protein n=1 Tax=Pantanalinema sp. GBBB05 TaxID=2604139 RepID=UPI001DA6116C|nr:hypothetical protein [Pantanalinema sp. GBBB05]